MKNFLSRFVDSNEREIRRLRPIVDATNALADEFKAGTLAFDAATGHLKRGDGPCRFCVNSLWTFPERCAYGKPDLPTYGPGELEAAVETILERARSVAATPKAS